MTFPGLFRAPSIVVVRSGLLFLLDWGLACALGSVCLWPLAFTWLSCSVANWISHLALTLSLLDLPLTRSGEPLASQAICMSDHRSLLDKVSAAAEHLQSASSLLAEVSAVLTASPSLTGEGSLWTVTEPAWVPFAESFEQIRSELLLRGPEEGPPLTPGCAVRAAFQYLSGFPTGFQGAADRAFRAGFWARVSLETCTEYRPLEPLSGSGFQPWHWVVLSPAERGGNYRTEGELDADNFCTYRKAPIESFATITEVEIFCLGAGCIVPPLRQKCRSHQ